MPTRAAAVSALPRDEAIRGQAGSSWSPSDDLVAALSVLDRRAAGGSDGGPSVPGPVHSADPSSAPPIAGRRQLPRVGRRLGFLRGVGRQSLRVDRAPAAQKAVARADRARDARDWPSAARYYREALDLKPDNALIWVQYGHALKESGNLPEAENAYRNALGLDADVADTHLQLGHALKIQGRKIEATVAYLRALALDPALDHASHELQGLGWTKGRIELTLRRERSGAK